MGTYPYWLHIAPRGKSATIQIEQIRELILWMMSKAPDGRQRVAVLQDAHRMNEAGQNCLLKTLEEPPDGALIILLTDEPSRLLPTVVSRCMIVGIEADKPVPEQTDLELAATILSALQTNGYAGVFDRAAFVDAGRKGRMPAFLGALEYLLRNKMIEETTAGTAQGVRLHEERGWAWVLPSATRPECSVICEGNTAEVARELGAFYTDLVNRHKAHIAP